jgi:hypothetical protein
MRKFVAASAMALAVAATAPLLAQGAAKPVSASAAAVDSRAVVAEVRRIIAERYVLPGRRPEIDAILAKGLSSGRYDLRDAGALAERINQDLETAGRDRHLNFAYDPKQAEIYAASHDAKRPDHSAYERQVRSANHGVTELKLLPGNVRYLAYDGFHWMGPESAAALDTAMRFLAGGDAAIIDIRRNGGGSPQAVQYLVSHFMAEDKPLMTFHMNGKPAPDTTATLKDLRAGGGKGAAGGARRRSRRPRRGAQPRTAARRLRRKLWRAQRRRGGRPALLPARRTGPQPADPARRQRLRLRYRPGAARHLRTGRRAHRRLCHRSGGRAQPGAVRAQQVRGKTRSPP